MMVREALVWATRHLAASSSTPRLDAELLMAKAMGIERDALLLYGLENEAPPAFNPLVDRRSGGEPIAYITGRRAFWTIELEVGRDVLVPRPDSETLIEAAIEHCAARPPARILDLGTGSGALLLAALDHWPEAKGVGIDISSKALAVAGANARRLGFAARARWQRGDWAEGIDGNFDLVLCNPPYIAEDARLPKDVTEWEPHDALFAGADGLTCYRVLAPVFPRLIAEGGVGCVEIGLGQQSEVTKLFEHEGLAVAARRDLAGHVRCLILTH